MNGNCLSKIHISIIFVYNVRAALSLQKTAAFKL